ncbi:uncharacterized protein [Gossypium hirsutum]|uniref:G-patch domain-containing protein n=1 Tax=Gossypium hirsutum TaxID=3635 RepID=A0A1U8HTU1_GOSHI|nr:uncharacterized protein LOC107887639 [Gossypium hirsutum]
MAGEMIENAIRGGKIEGEVAKRSAPRRKDNEVNNTSSFNSKAITVGQPKVTAGGQQGSQRQESSTRHERMQFTPIPVTYRELYQSLYEAHVIAPFHLKPLQPPYPKWHDANARCEYHAGISGHSIENFTGFKKVVERLIKMGVVKFDSTPNTENPLPNHDNQRVNAIGEASERRMKENIAEVRIPMKVIWEEMMKRGMITSKKEREKLGNYCEFHGEEGHEAQNCKELRALVQGFIDNKELQIFEGSSYKREISVLEGEQKGTSRPRIIISLPGNNEVGTLAVAKVIIDKPTPFSYKDSKRVPWNYDCSVTGPKEENIASASKDVQAKGSHTRSGKHYDTGGVRVEPKKTKSVEVEKETEVPINELVSEEEAKKFLKFLKHSEYSVVEQLHKQLAHISVLALLLCFEAHREALMKVLNETYVTHDISVNKLDRLVNNISADNFIYFNDDEIPPGGRGSIKAFHITTRCKGPWIHSAGAMPSSLHQKLKLVTNGRLITINTEDIITAFTSKAAYVEINEESIECSFRSLEFVNATFILEGSELPVPRIARATRMALQMMTGKGALPGRGLGKYLQGGTQISKLIEKKDRFGLGFKPDYKQRKKDIEKRQERRRARLDGREVGWKSMTFPLISKTFISRGLLVEESYQINAANDDELEQRNLEGIRPYESGSSLNNWTVEELPDFEDVQGCDVSPDLLRIVKQEERQIMPHEKEAIENEALGEGKEVKIRTLIAKDTRQELIELLREFKDIFAWSYQDMPGLNTDIVVHRLPIRQGSELWSYTLNLYEVSPRRTIPPSECSPIEPADRCHSVALWNLITIDIDSSCNYLDA